MSSKNRCLLDFFQADLKQRMVFVGGPRQVGKTTLALALVGAESKSHPAYLNWDFVKDKKRIREADLPYAESIIVLDKLHKYRAFEKTFPQNN